MSESRFDGTVEELLPKLADMVSTRLARAEARDWALLGIVSTLAGDLNKHGMLSPRFVDIIELLRSHLKAGPAVVHDDVDLIADSLLRSIGRDAPPPKRPSFTVIDGGLS